MGFIAYFGLALTLMRGQTDTASNAAPSALEQFKQFICSPPVINNIVFQKKVPMGGGMRPLDGSFARSTSFEYFQAKWQTNGFLFRQLSSPTDTTNFTVAGHLISWSGHKHALWEPDWFFTTWDDRDPSVKSKDISIFYTSDLFLDPLREVLNLGVLYAEIGTIRWEGNRFRAERYVDHQRILITGELMAIGEGSPRQMKTRYEFPNRTFEHVIRYGYSPSLKYAYLPTAIEDFWVSGSSGGTNDEIEVNEWRVLDVRTLDGPLLPEAFDAEVFARQNRWRRRVYKSSGFYVKAPDGALVFTGTLGAQNAGQGQQTSLRLRLLYVGWGGLNIAIFALMVGARETAEKHNNQEDNG